MVTAPFLVEGENHEVVGLVGLRRSKAVGAGDRHPVTGQNSVTGLHRRPGGIKAVARPAPAGPDRTNRPETHLRGSADQCQGPFLVVHAGQGDHHALLDPRNLRFGNAKTINPVTNDLHRLVEHRLVYRFSGDEPHRYPALQVETEKRFVAPENGQSRSCDGKGHDPTEEYDLTAHGCCGCPKDGSVLDGSAGWIIVRRVIRGGPGEAMVDGASQHL